MVPKDSSSDDIVVCCLEASTSVLFALKICQGFSWAVSLRGVPLKRDTCQFLTTLPESLTTISSVYLVIEQLKSCCVCVGNMEDKFLKLTNMRKGVFTDATGIYYSKLHVCWYCISMRLYLSRDKGSGKGRKYFKPETDCPSHIL